MGWKADLENRLLVSILARLFLDWVVQVRIPTQIYDEMGPVDEDPRWRIMGDFHKCTSISPFPSTTR